MSRKSTRKSNITLKSDVPQIGIFTEKPKTATYNRLILQVLLTEELEAYPLAEKLREIMSPSDMKETALEKRYRVQKIYSVIQRKNGRLADLKNKGYITEKNGKWVLTRKGLIAISVDKPELVDKILESNKEKFIELSRAYTGKARTVFGLEIDLSQLKPLFEKVDFEYVYHLIVEEARILLSSGFELDRISEGDFVSIVYNALLTKGKAAELMEKFLEGLKNGSS